MEYKKLNNGVIIPSIGFGVFRIEDGAQTLDSVKWALEAGYRHIDTAKYYANENSVAKAIKEYGLKREEIFITTKLWNDDVRNETVDEAFNRSLKELETDYIDLYLIHWPVEKRELAWAKLEEYYKQGRIKAIGVSNFQIHHIEELEKTAHILPAVNQIESHPYFQNQELIDYCLKRGIAVEVWAPLGGSKTTMVRDDPTIKKLADKYHKTPTQIIIRWHLQRGVIVLPKSTHEQYIKDNINVFDFELSNEDMDIIKGLETGTRIGRDPDNFNF